MTRCDWQPLLEVPFEYKGRDVEVGLDCFGQLIEFYRLAGFEIPDPLANYDDDETHDAAAAAELFGDIWRPVPAPSEFGDVVLMERPPGGDVMHPLHVGVVVETGIGKMLHTMKSAGGVVSRISPFRRRIKGYYRLIEDVA